MCYFKSVTILEGCPFAKTLFKRGCEMTGRAAVWCLMLPAICAVVAVTTVAQEASEETAPKQDSSPSAETVLVKCAETYKNLKVLYEKGEILVTENDSTEIKDKGSYALAFRRGKDAAYFESTKTQNLIITTDPGDPLEDLLFALPWPDAYIKLRNDPVGFVKDELDVIGKVETVELDGTKVFKVEVNAPGTSLEKRQVLYVHRESFLIVGVDNKTPSQIWLPDSENEVRTFHAYRSKESYVDEVPKDASGKEIGVRAYAQGDGQGAPEGPRRGQQRRRRR